MLRVWHLRGCDGVKGNERVLRYGLKRICLRCRQMEHVFAKFMIAFDVLRIIAGNIYQVCIKILLVLFHFQRTREIFWRKESVRRNNELRKLCWEL